MSAASSKLTLGRTTRIGHLATTGRHFIKRSLVPLVGLMVAEAAFLYYSGSPGATCFTLISIGTVILLALWRSTGIGLPILPLLAIQNLIAYGLPIVIGHEVLAQYPESFVTDAGLEVLIFSVCMAGAWGLAMQVFTPSDGFCYALQGINRDGTEKLQRIGFALILGSSLFLFLKNMDLLDFFYALIPSGGNSIVMVLVSSASTCGFFLVAMFMRGDSTSVVAKITFWGLLAANCLLSASGFLLSGASMIVFSVLIGLFWSSGRIPWLYLTVVVLILSFLNLGKVTMRERYWSSTGDEEESVTFKLSELPGIYTEWIDASYDALTLEDSQTGSWSSLKNPEESHQSILERINNLQNILFVIDAMKTQHITPLEGSTYTLIPPLLLPRILWPEKPRTHEGQIILNVHFGRQDQISTARTFVAWGLLAEAYGNFGAKFGSLILGIFLGVLCAWIENITANKLLLSTEGFVSFAIILGLANSFEMVASVLVTSIFQSIVPLIIASAPFVEHVLPRQNDEPAVVEDST